MAYRPPQKRFQMDSKDSKLPVQKNKDKDKEKDKNKWKEDFPALANAIETTSVSNGVSKMNFASLFKNAIQKKKRVKKLKWGTVLLTKKGVIDSLTPEERIEEEEIKNTEIQEQRLWTMCCRLDKQQNIRREFDPHYESPQEYSESESEEELEEEEEVLTDDYEEDEFEPEI
jgi:hypothetical protein